MSKKKQQSSSSSSFFLIPNPFPHLRSFNIPAPIIYPPGVEPCSFLNPNPNGGAGDRLDVDPCAAPRTGIITKTTDLTPSEHAGESLHEAPMAAAMASDSPANSETSAPQIVNDVVETKIETLTTQIFRCDVCDVNCNSEFMFMDHMEGKRHLKTMQKLSVSSAVIQETPPPVADAASNQESEKTKTDFFQNEATVKSLAVCKIPAVEFSDQNIFTERQKQETQSTSLSGTAAQPSNSRTQEVQGELNVSQLLWCELCRISCSSDDNFRAHKTGKKHMKNLEKSRRIQAPPSATPVVSLAAATPTTKPVEKTGDSEEAKLQNAEKKPRLPSPLIDSVNTQCNDPVENLKSAKGEVVNPKEGGSPPRCELCKIYCTSYDELKRHLSGKKHSKNVGKKPNLSTLAAEKLLLQDFGNDDGKMVILESSKRKANGSLAVEEDADTKRPKKMMMMEDEGASCASITCKACNVGCTNVGAFMDHLASKEHSVMALKQVNVEKQV